MNYTQNHTPPVALQTDACLEVWRSASLMWGAALVASGSSKKSIQLCKLLKGEVKNTWENWKRKKKKIASVEKKTNGKKKNVQQLSVETR